ncbi:MAG: hypothetical protein RI947_1505 [Candidatus Parcubacteria bacterium]|jgi:hypothetical protein
MKVIFTASLRGKKYFEPQYKRTVDVIKKLGYETNAEDLIHPSNNKIYTDIQEGSRDANVAMYKKKIQELQEADICMFETSTHSLAIGFMIQKALEFNKPTIVLYYKDNAPDFLTGVEDDKLIVKNYDDDNLEAVVTGVLGEGQNMRDKRFNFFISPKLLSYLENTSRKDGVTKSTFIRNLILDHRKKFKL